MWTVNILECSDKTHYVGCTSNLEDRLRRDWYSCKILYNIKYIENSIDSLF